MLVQSNEDFHPYICMHNTALSDVSRHCKAFDLIAWDGGIIINWKIFERQRS
jgi:hypothetical protein